MARDRATVLVVDDDGDIRLSLEMMLQYEGFEVWTAKDGEEALARIGREAQSGRAADLVLCDVKMPRLDGPGLLDRLAEHIGAPSVIMISGHGDIATAVDALRRGAVDFLEKPLEHNRVVVSLRNALRERRLAVENAELRTRLGEPWRLVGTSGAMCALREQVARVARSDASVLISGENGSGKEVVARQIHLESARAAAAFVTVNCAAIPSELIESELFGHEKGSFTGAFERRTGHFELAHGGTLFLDEIGDMPLPAQAKVLRALETREVTRVGGSRPVPVDIRIVAATNADLAAAVEAKLFRMDLFYRLNVVPLRVAPLRERREDIAALASHFLRELAARVGRAPHALAPDAQELLATLEFPGNVRELRNLLEGACVLADGPMLARADLERILENGAGGAMRGRTSRPHDAFSAATFEEFKDRSEAEFFRRKLAENEGNVKRTAELLGMQRSHLYKKLERYGLK
ncbi:MAG: sigma-54-dependent Fis family transcriptional regulator [Planctomycetes bacterium]|nr:sigma-54-dependent Fis family transcriptional regulator [Planctomycetota bacterium]